MQIFSTERARKKIHEFHGQQRANRYKILRTNVMRSHSFKRSSVVTQAKTCSAVIGYRPIDIRCTTELLPLPSSLHVAISRRVKGSVRGQGNSVLLLGLLDPRRKSVHDLCC